MRKTISLVLAVLMMLVLLPAVKLSPAVAEETPELTLDFTSNTWGLPTDYSTETAEYTDTVTGCKITIAAGSGYKFAGDYLIYGKTDAALTLPAFDFDVAKIVVVGRGGASGNTKMNVFVGDNAVSDETTGCKETNTYVIAGDSQAAGTIYSLKVTNNYNAQATKIEIYKADGTEPEPSPSTEPEPSPSTEPEPEPETTAMELVEQLLDGDKVVLYHPASSKVMTGEDYLYNNKKHELVAADAALTEGVLAVPETAVVLTVEIEYHPGDTESPELNVRGEEGYYTYAFKTEDGKYLYADGTNTQLLERTEENKADTLFQLENAENGSFIRCNTATYTDKDGNVFQQYLEYYSGYFTVYSKKDNSVLSDFTFQFYAKPGETPEPPVVEPTGDTIILFTNDVHCGIRDGWGYAGVADLKKSLKAEGNEVLLVDAGDHSQGGPIGSLTQGEAIIDIMNFVGYDLAIPGNHEFDYGMEQFFALTQQAKYPYISANFMDLEKNAPVFDAYKIFEANGKKIAFVGLSTPESITKSTPTYFMNEAGEYIYGFCQDDTGAGVYTAAQAGIDAAKAAGADYVIVVGHMGIDEQSSPWMATEVIANVTGVDAFIDGHSHSVINGVEVKDKDGKNVLHGQTGTKLANVGKLTIKADGTLTMELLPVSEKVQDDPDADAFIKGIEDEFDALLNTVVAHTDHLLTVNDADGNRAVRKHETNLGDLCADAYRFMFDSDIAFVNGGGVRANIPTGDITFQQIINVHPFGNTAVLAEVTGQQILDALEMGARVYPSENGGFLQVAGLKYEIHPDVEPNCVVGNDKMWAGPVDPAAPYRVQNVRVENKETGKYEPLDLTKKYTLASHNYMLKDMGDGFAMFGPNITILEDSGKLDNQVLIDYIKSMPEVDGKHEVKGYTRLMGEGRIVVPNGETVVLFTNDVHCGIRDGWGYAGVADLKKSLEAEGYAVLLVDAGDHSQGGPIGSLTQGEAIIDIMNFVGYDLATLGNHEFDYGMDRLFELIDIADYPYVSANFMDLEKNAPVLDAYKIFEANGKKIAFVGLSTPESITKSTPTYFMNEAGEYIYGFCQDDTGAGVYTAAQAAIDAAKAEGADYIIAVGHMGIDEQSKPWTAPEVIANVTGLNAFIDGHSHSVINGVEVKDKDGKNVLHGQTGTKLANVGKLTIKADGTLTMELLPASAKVQDDPDADAFIKGIEDEFDALLNSVVAHTDHLLTVNNPETGERWVRKHETNLGDLCADAYRFMFDSDIAFVNGGGVRANIPEGDITFQQIINVHPFGNTAVLAEVTGQQILDALEMGARVCPTENGGFLQVAGLKYEIHTYVEPNCVVGSDKMWAGPVDPEGEYRVKNVMIENKETGEFEPLDLEKKYTLASHNYMLKDMGDGFAMFGPNITVLEDSGKLDNQVLIDYIQSMPEVDGKHEVEGYLVPGGEGRITIVDSKAATFFGEDVKAADVLTEVDGVEIYRYDVKVKGIDPEAEVVGMQAFVQYDTAALEFVEATSELEGSTGINEKNGVISFAWASNGDGITVADDTVVVSLFFKLVKPLADGASVEFLFVPAENGALTGYSYVDGDSVKEADEVNYVNGSITFEVPGELTIYGEDVKSLDVMSIQNGERVYRYDVKVKDLPEAGLKVNSAQVFLTFDDALLEYRSFESGKLDWMPAQDGNKVFAVWASETDVLIENEEVLFSIYFAAPNAKGGEKADIKFTVNTLNTGSAMSFAFGGQVVEIEATTIDGSITFAEVTLGDANCDGQVTAADAALVLRSLVGLNELTAQGALNADVDGDAEITAEDAAIILRYIVKLIDKFPVEETAEEPVEP